MSKDNKLVPAGNSAMATHSEVPEWLRSEVGNQKGMEQVDQSDILLPRLGLCQSLSPERRKGDAKQIPGIEEGQFFNTVTREVYGSVIKVVPLFFFKNRIKYFPIDEGGGIECISANGIDGGKINPTGCASCRFSVWGNGEMGEAAANAPQCTMYHNFMSFTLEDPSPLAVSYKATGLKISKQFLANIRLTRLPMYAKIYQIEAVEMRDGQNVWFDKKFIPIAWTDSDLFKQMEQNFESLKQMNITVDTTGEEGSTDFPGGGKSSEPTVQF